MTTLFDPPASLWQQLLPGKDVAAAFHRSELTLERAAKAGQFPTPVRLRGKLYWHLHDLNQWVLAQRRPLSEAGVVLEPGPSEAGDEGGAK